MTGGRKAPILTALDRPVWHALKGPQAALSRTMGGALRIDPAYGPFAAAHAGCEQDLVGLLDGASDEIWLIEAAPPPVPVGLKLVRQAHLLQLAADAPGGLVDPEIVPLGAADVPAMTALALANKPGPWGASTWRYGTFYGVRREGRLVAMAGQRLRPAPGLAEVSGVCTVPECRGQGLARRLIGHVMAAMGQRGETPFLHSYADNAGAIALYQSLGFRPRAELVALILQKDTDLP